MHSGAPAVFAAELHEQRSRPRDLLSLRVEAVAGAPLPDALFRTVQEELWPTLLTAYSLTEASTMITLTTLEDSIARRMGTVGRPIGETSFCVLDPGGSELPPESLGEIGVRGPGVTWGYCGSRARRRSPSPRAGTFARETSGSWTTTAAYIWWVAAEALSSAAVRTSIRGRSRIGCSPALWSSGPQGGASGRVPGGSGLCPGRSRGGGDRHRRGAQGVVPAESRRIQDPGPSPLPRRLPHDRNRQGPPCRAGASP